VVPQNDVPKPKKQHPKRQQERGHGGKFHRDGKTQQDVPVLFGVPARDGGGSVGFLPFPQRGGAGEKEGFGHQGRELNQFHGVNGKGQQHDVGREKEIRVGDGTAQHVDHGPGVFDDGVDGFRHATGKRTDKQHVDDLKPDVTGRGGRFDVAVPAKKKEQGGREKNEIVGFLLFWPFQIWSLVSTLALNKNK
jgi:hypothetical protein